jgi:hypothetical protein
MSQCKNPRMEAVLHGVCATCHSIPHFTGPSRFFQEREWRQTGLCPVCLESELKEIYRKNMLEMRKDQVVIWSLAAAVCSVVSYFAWRLL